MSTMPFLKAALPLLLIVAVALAGCTDAGPGQPLSEGTFSPGNVGHAIRHFNETFRLEVGPIDRVPAQTLGPNCAGFTPTDEQSMYHILGGNATLTWDSSQPFDDLSILLTAENVGGIRRQSPEGPSPITLDFGAINVTWQDALAIQALLPIPSLHVMEPATLEVRFDYVGHDVWSHLGYCGSS